MLPMLLVLFLLLLVLLLYLFRSSLLWTPLIVCGFSLGMAEYYL